MPFLAKRNLGTDRSLAPITVGLGPGFTAGEDVDAVVETMRGTPSGACDLCRGRRFPDTGVPGAIAGYAAERVIHAPAAGRNALFVQDETGADQWISARWSARGRTIARVGGTPVLRDDRRRAARPDSGGLSGDRRG